VKLSLLVATYGSIADVRALLAEFEFLNGSIDTSYCSSDTMYIFSAVV